ncbi:MAG: ribonuclease P protein component [Patescibacteria group bacterium]
MLPKKNRLIKRVDFNRVYRYGNFIAEGPLSIKFAKNELKNARIGFSIEKKFFKKATERNKIKRLLRKAFHLNLAEIKLGMDIVVFYKKSEGKPDFKIISELVEKLIKKIK